LESGKDETWLRGWVLERAFGLGEISSGAAEQLRVFGVGKGSRRVAEAQRFGVRRLREEVMRLEVRWLMMLLIFAGLLWLWQIDGEVGDQAQGVELSERRVLDASWRGKSEREMTVGEMEGYAAGLSDEELWGELGKSYDDWLEVNRGRTWFYQPRLAVMLAREVGKRDGEAGMKKVARWLEERDASFKVEPDNAFGGLRQFFELRFLIAGYAGWVSEDPEEAIGRLIESRKNEEEDWPVVNEAYVMYFKVPAFSGIEEVLREGFRILAGRDMVKAEGLLRAGFKAGAFDISEVSEGFFFEIPKEKRSRMMRSLIDEKPDLSEGSGFEQEVEIEVLEGELSFDLWIPGFTEELISRAQSANRYSDDQLPLLVRARPEESIKIVRNERTDDETKRWLVLWLGSEDVENYPLLEHVPDDLKLRVVDGWLAVSSELDFGLITGRENPGALDLGLVREAVEKAEMSDEVRGEITELLDERAE
jgi:hypothetical protein